LLSQIVNIALFSIKSLFRFFFEGNRSSDCHAWSWFFQKTNYIVQAPHWRSYIYCSGNWWVLFMVCFVI